MRKYEDTLASPASLMRSELIIYRSLIEVSMLYSFRPFIRAIYHPLDPTADNDYTKLSERVVPPCSCQLRGSRLEINVASKILGDLTIMYNTVIQ